MPGKDIEDMTLREARREGVTQKWRERKLEEKRPDPKRSIDSATVQKENIGPGDILAVRQLPIPGFLDSINILVNNPIPGDYGAEIEVKRQGTGLSTIVNLEEGQNEFSEFDFDFELRKNDLIEITLVDQSTSGGEVATIDEVLTTIATSHA